MAVSGWVLIQTEVGRARQVAEAVAAIRVEGVRVLTSDTVTGPHDVIAHLEAPDLDALSDVVEATLEAVPGVEHTITCVTIRPGSGARFEE